MPDFGQDKSALRQLLGVSGEVVGTTDTQPLSNKTFTATGGLYFNSNDGFIYNINSGAANGANRNLALPDMFFDDTLLLSGHSQLVFNKTFSGMKLGSDDKTTAYTLTDTNTRIRADASSAAFTLTLPTAVFNDGRLYNIKKIDTTFNIVTVDANSTETIDGMLTFELKNPGDELLIVSDGANWRTIITPNYDYSAYRRIGATAPNRYYVAGMDVQAAFGTAAAVVANTLYAQPFNASRGATIDSVGVNVSAVVAGSGVRMGVYRSLNGVPGALVADFGIVATTNPAAFKEITGLSQKLQPGLYWLAAVFSHTPTIRQIPQAAILGIYGVDNAATTAVGTGYTGSLTYGALPSNFPTITVSTAATQPALFYHMSA